MSIRSCVALISVVCLVAPATASASCTSGPIRTVLGLLGGVHRLACDDFADWPRADRWSVVADDGSATGGPEGLIVDSAPFRFTAAQEDDDAFGRDGRRDRIKWWARSTRSYAARDGRQLVLAADLGGRTEGTADHPFSGAVSDADDDPRLASMAFSADDEATGLSFGFWLTNRRVWAVSSRRDVFVAALPVTDRDHRPSRLAIAYDRRQGRVRWLVDGREVRRADRLGRRPGRDALVVDHGAPDADLRPVALAPSFGTQSFLDATLGGLGLVRLSNRAGFYFDPGAGAPAPGLFLDNSSFDVSRAFGQGAVLRVQRVEITDQRNETSA